jgi:hypothetical protein
MSEKEIGRRIKAVQSTLSALEVEQGKINLSKAGLMQDLLTGSVPIIPGPDEASNV